MGGLQLILSKTNKYDDINTIFCVLICLGHISILDVS